MFAKVLNGTKRPHYPSQLLKTLDYSVGRRDMTIKQILEMLQRGGLIKSWEEVFGSEGKKFVIEFN